MRKKIEKNILGIRVDNLNLAEVVEKIEDLAEEGGFHLVVTMNPEILMAARKDKEFLEIINKKAALVTADGIGINLAGKLLSKSLKERITGNDLIKLLVQLCLQKNWLVMLMGGQPEVAQKALENLEVEYPKLLGIVTSHPLKSFNTEIEIEFLADLIKKEKPIIILVAMDFGEREKFLLQLIKVLKKENFKQGMVFVGVGGALDYLAGTAKRAPIVLQKVGLEWLWRLITEPRKRLLRQLKTLPLFAFLVLKETLRQKIGEEKVR